MVAFIAGNIPADCHPKVGELAAYWLSLHPEGGGLPGRQHFDPCDIPALLPNLYLVDVGPGAGEFTFRLMGTALVKLFGRDHTGLPFEGAYQSGRKSHSYRDITDLLESRQPRWRRAPGRFMKGRDHLILERVSFPLAGDGRTVDIVLGMILARSESGERMA